MRVLIAFGSRYGSTQQAALAMAEELRAVGDSVDLVEAGTQIELDAYDLAIVGSALFVGHMRRGAARLIRQIHERGDLPLAVFALGPLVPEQVESSRAELDAAMLRARAGDVPYELFGGAIVPERMPFPFKHMEAADMRDFAAMRAWARVQRALVPMVPAS